MKGRAVYAGVETEFVHQFQQPLTALRLMVEGLERGVIAHSPQVTGSLLNCVQEMQQYLDALYGIEEPA
jgi:hypothetical protein